MREEANRFATKLLKKTKEGKLPWEGTYDPNSFICVLNGDLSFTVAKDEQDSYFLEMKDDAETVAFRESMRAPDSQTSHAYDQQYEILAELYECARRAALQIDKKIARAEEFLDKL
jgi:hypothetical protein